MKARRNIIHQRSGMPEAAIASHMRRWLTPTTDAPHSIGWEEEESVGSGVGRTFRMRHVPGHATTKGATAEKGGGGGGHKEKGGQITGWMKTPTDGGGNDDNNDGNHRDEEWFLVAAMERGRGNIDKESVRPGGSQDLGGGIPEKHFIGGPPQDSSTQANGSACHRAAAPPQTPLEGEEEDVCGSSWVRPRGGLQY